MKHLLILCGLVTGLSFGLQAQKFGHIDTQVLLGALVNNSDFESKYQAKELEWQSLVAEMETNLQNLAMSLRIPTLLPTLSTEQGEISNSSSNYRVYFSLLNKIFRVTKLSFFSPRT